MGFILFPLIGAELVQITEESESGSQSDKMVDNCEKYNLLLLADREGRIELCRFCERNYSKQNLIQKDNLVKTLSFLMNLRILVNEYYSMLYLRR